MRSDFLAKACDIFFRFGHGVAQRFIGRERGVEQFRPRHGQPVGGEFCAVEFFREFQQRGIAAGLDGVNDGAGALLNDRIEQAGSGGGFAELRGKIRIGVADDFHADSLGKTRRGRKKSKNFGLRCADSLFFAGICVYLCPSVADKIKNPIIAALDVPAAEQALKLAREIAPAVGAFKIGSELFTSAGPDIVKKIRATGAAVFLDLKFHDIPNTVAKAVAAAARLDVQMLTIHTSGGLEMMRAAEASAQQTANQAGLNAPLVLGVTVLTSSDSRTLAEIGCAANVGAQVERLANLAVKAGLRGLVCSPLEIADLRQILPAHIQLVTPGIRTGAEKADDQKRTLTPREAIDAGANWLVIGRPIYAAQNPRAAAEKILESVVLTTDGRATDEPNGFGR